MYESIRNDTLLGSCIRFLCRTAARLKIHILVVLVKRMTPEELRDTSPYVIERPELAKVLEMGKTESTPISEDFIRAAWERGDRCMVAWLDGQAVAYSWVSFTSAPGPAETTVVVPNDCAYGYKSYTVPEYRGEQLFPKLMELSSQLDYTNGIRNRVCYVAAFNKPSLRSVNRTGYKPVGLLMYRQTRGKVKTWHSKPVRKLGFKIIGSN